MRTLQQIVAEITREAPSAWVMGGKRYYAHVEIPGSGGAHVIIYLAPEGENSIATMRRDQNDNGHRISFQRGSEREERMIETVSNFLVLHETIRDRRERAEKKEGA